MSSRSDRSAEVKSFTLAEAIADPDEYEFLALDLFVIQPDVNADETLIRAVSPSDESGQDDMYILRVAGVLNGFEESANNAGIDIVNFTALPELPEPAALTEYIVLLG